MFVVVHTLLAVLPEAPQIIRTCVPLLPGGPTSCTVGNPETECSLSRLSAGNTNKLYKLTREERGDCFLVRIFGTESALPFDRDGENAAFEQLGRAGLAPPMIATFRGPLAGRIEGWLEGGPVEVEACRTPEVYEQVARALAALHRFELEQPTASTAGDVPTAWGVKTALAWLPAAIERQREVARIGEGEYARRVEALELDSIRERLDDLIEELEDCAPPQCYCHNDLSNTNLHREPASGIVRLIDFEYGGYNYRGFDLATHLSHWAGGAEDGRYDDDAFPDPHAFLSAYAAAAADDELKLKGEPTVGELLEEVRLCAPLAHCVWGLWAVCSLPAEEATPFSHIEYAERRLAAFESLMVDL